MYRLLTGSVSWGAKVSAFFHAEQCVWVSFPNTQLSPCKKRLYHQPLTVSPNIDGDWTGMQIMIITVQAEKMNVRVSRIGWNWGEVKGFVRVCSEH